MKLKMEEAYAWRDILNLMEHQMKVILYRLWSLVCG